MTEITAKITCTNKEELGDGQAQVRFAPDYAEGRNSSWAAATPALSLSMCLKGDVADDFQVGQAYELRFIPEASE
jgi:hypothetical protein